MTIGEISLNKGGRSTKDSTEELKQNFGEKVGWGSLGVKAKVGKLRNLAMLNTKPCLNLAITSMVRC